VRMSAGTNAGLMTALLLFTAQARAEEKDKKEPFAEIEFGGAGEWGLSNGGSSFGPTVAVEFTPIEHWLEIEAGVTPLFSRGQTEWGTDLIFKKPWTLSKTVEFMVGAGPEWRHTTGSSQTANSLAGEVVLDFQIWPSPDRKFGWFVEPIYSYSFSKEHEQALGVNVGLLITIP
jgi:hypothetical protein